MNSSLSPANAWIRRERAVAILREELEKGLALLGVERPELLDRTYLQA